MTSLMVGLETAKALALAWDIPTVGVNHLSGHLWSWQLPTKNIQYPIPNNQSISNAQYPMLGLIVSGGHTELVLVKGYEKYQVIGQTLDDAAGEAFDKVAKILGLEYPGGPVISNLAEKGDSKAYDFPRPMLKSDNFDFSFAGLKTAVLYKVRDLAGKTVGDNYNSRPSKTRSEDRDHRRIQGDNDNYRLPQGQVNDLCASFQQAVVDTLVYKTVKAAEKYKVKTVVLGGGVVANRLLRKTMKQELRKVSLELRLPELQYTSDNAAMIALAGYYRHQAKGADDFRKLVANPNLGL